MVRIGRSSHGAIVARWGRDITDDLVHGSLRGCRRAHRAHRFRGDRRRRAPPAGARRCSGRPGLRNGQRRTGRGGKGRAGDRGGHHARTGRHRRTQGGRRGQIRRVGDRRCVRHRPARTGLRRGDLEHGDHLRRAGQHGRRAQPIGEIRWHTRVLVVGARRRQPVLRPDRRGPRPASGIRVFARSVG